VEANLPDLVTFSDTARRLKIDRRTVADLVKAHEIPTRPHPLNGSAKCIDITGFNRICSLLLRDELTQSA